MAGKTLNVSLGLQLLNSSKPFSGPQAQALSVPLGAVQLLAAATVAVAVWPIYAGAAAIYRNEFLAEVIGPIIDSTLKPIGLTMLLLAAAA